MNKSRLTKSKSRLTKSKSRLSKRKSYKKAGKLRLDSNSKNNYLLF